MSKRVAATSESAGQVAAVVRAGGVALIPTDTVYGLAVDPENPWAVGRLYEIKGRPAQRPIALLVEPDFDLASVAEEVPTIALKAARQFWPGGLTIVLRRKAGCLEAVSAGAATVGLRSPDHPYIQTLLAKFGRPVAATSANFSGQPSPASFEEVDSQIVEQVNIAVDDGPCRTKIHSTVVDFSVDPPRVLRVGAIPPAELSACLGVQFT